jgi:integral membrane protein
MSTNLNRLRILAWLEGISFLLLLGVTMPLKYYYEMPTPNLVIGMLHGLLFIAYCTCVLIVRAEEKWTGSITFWALLASLLPFGTFVADARLFRK